MSVTLKRGGRVLAATLGVVAIIAAPANAADDTGDLGACTPQATLTQPFTAWSDFGLYTPVADAGVENGAADWALAGGAAVAGGNEPWSIGGAADSHSLDLPSGASAMTAPMCIDETYTHFRFFARNAGAASGSLKVDVEYYDNHGNVVDTKDYVYTAASADWALTPTIEIAFRNKAAAPVAFRFTANGHYVIDDVYIDPWARG